jgi:cellulose 1,4-beta-cellobiosidase
MYKVFSLGMIVLATVVGLTPATGHHQVKHPHKKVHRRVLCKPYEHIRTKGKKGIQYVVRNDNYGHKRECLVNHDGTANFKVIKQEEKVGHAEPVAYPNIFYGCSWGICSPHSGLPRKLYHARSMTTSWSLREHAKGTWGAGYDIWLDRTKSRSGQSRGAELMIWLDSRGFPPNRWPVVTVNHVRYHLAHWVAGSHGKHWQYIQFRRVHATSHVANLRIRPFIKVAERFGYVKKGWWLTNVEAGFEIWRGGIGLGTKSFSVHL